MPGRIDTEKWKAILAGPLPGERGHQRMATGFRGAFHHDGDPVPAAVMILLYPAEKERTGLVLMKRNAYDGPHSAQVSLPGGAREKEDRSLAGTALRETREELGITEDLEILGPLSPLHIPVSNFIVHPFVAHCRQRPEFRPDSSEVEYLIETTLEHLLDPRFRRVEKRTLHGTVFPSPYFSIGEEKVWGATAMILSEFLLLASSLQAHHH